MSKLTPDKVIKNISTLHSMEPGEAPLSNAAIAIQGDKIIWIGKEAELETNCDVANSKSIDAERSLALPGLIDCHTHFLFGGSRQHEFVMRLQGKSYQEIGAAGGGIRSSVEATRTATDEELQRVGRKRLEDYLAQGVTTVEAKSGYALNTVHELRTLRNLKKLNDEQSIDIVSTFLGAHWLPKEFEGKRDGFLDLVCKEMIPLVREENLATFCDVFCDVGAFDAKESEKVLQAGIDSGLKAKIHTEEFEAIGGAELAGQLHAASADHLCQLNESGISALREGGVVGVLLPGTTFFLNSDHYAPARKMLEAGMRVALATDFNPGSNTSQNLFLTGTIACLRMRLTPAEVLPMITLDAAAAIGLEQSIGSLKAGKQADIALFDAPDIDYLFYHYGSNHLHKLIKGGNLAA